jgi:hypothetical protein
MGLVGSFVACHIENDKQILMDVCGNMPTIINDLAMGQ